MTYSIAIRTLGTSPATLRRELESIVRQTVQPERVVVYIAEGYVRPSFIIGREEYVWVRKGMVAQRALHYEEISSEAILMLDDDVELADDSAARMLAAMEGGKMDVVAADTFKNQDMTVRQRVMAWVSNFVYARKSDGWAFRQCRNGGFSFNGRPGRGLHLTETFAGPCWMVRKVALRAVRIEDELWMDRMGFAYGDDAVESYKFFVNGYRCGVLYDSGVENLDGKSSSGAYQRGGQKIYIRSKGQFATWWRMIYMTHDKRWLSALLYGTKAWWQLGVHILLGLRMMDIHIPLQYIRGQRDGWRMAHSDTFRNLPPYILHDKDVI